MTQTKTPQMSKEDKVLLLKEILNMKDTAHDFLSRIDKSIENNQWNKAECLSDDLRRHLFELSRRLGSMDIESQKEVVQ